MSEKREQGTNLMQPGSRRRSLLIGAQCTLALALFVAAGGMNGATCVPVTTGPGPGPDPAVQEALKVASDDHVLGSASAPTTVIEYADFQCPFCGRFARETFPTIKAEFIDTGKVRYVFRHFPLRSIHQCAESAGRGSECASDQGKFWEFADFLFNHQTPADNLCTVGLKNLAATASLGLDTNAFNACVDGNGKADRVQRDVNSGTLLGVPGTPAFFINGKLVSGFRTIEQFRADVGG